MSAHRSIWPKVAPEFANRAISAHALIGIVLGGLIYILALSGALLVFQDELGWWEAPEAPPISHMSPDAVEAAVGAALAADPQTTTDVVVYLPRPDLPRAIAATDNVSISLDANGRMAGPYNTDWTDFVTALHYHLHLPSTFGFVLVGVLGALMLGLIVSGLLAYPAIFRNAFALRRNGSARTTETDLHNRLAVWTLPFQLAIAFTGAWIGLFVLVGAIFAEIEHDGDRGVISDIVYGGSAPEHTQAGFPDVAAAMRYMATQAPGAIPTTLIVHDIGAAGQHMRIIALHEEEILLGEYYNFDGAGSFQGVAGLSDGALGKQIAIAMYPVHFGRFGGTWTRVLYVVLGFVLCIVVATGLNISLIKRQQKGRETKRLAAAWEALVWGAPAALALCLLAAVCGVAGDGLIGLFWGGLMLALCGAAIWPCRGAPTCVLQALTGAALASTLVVQFAIYGPTLWAAPQLAAATGCFGALGVVLLAAAFWRPPKAMIWPDGDRN